MKKPTFKKKLSLNKRDITVLSPEKMRQVQGGETVYPCTPYATPWCGFTTCLGSSSCG